MSEHTKLLREIYGAHGLHDEDRLDRDIARLVMRTRSLFDGVDYQNEIIGDAICISTTRIVDDLLAVPDNGITERESATAGVTTATAKRLANMLVAALRRCVELQDALDAERKAHAEDVRLARSAASTLRNDRFDTRVANAIATLESVDDRT